MRKKFMALALATAMVAGAVTGCGNKEVADDTAATDSSSSSDDSKREKKDRKKTGKIRKIRDSEVTKFGQ